MSKKWSRRGLLAAILFLPLAYSRIRFGEKNSHGEMTRCLGCGATFSDTETTCAKCGWSYQSDGSAEPL